MAPIQLRAGQIREEARVSGPRIPIGLGQTNFAEALARLFEDTLIDDRGGSNALTARLMNVFAASADSFAPNMSHFSGIFSDWTDSGPNGRRGDNGFMPCFQDYSLWPGSSMQVGHFLTAVDMGFQPRKLFNFRRSFNVGPIMGDFPVAGPESEPIPPTVVLQLSRGGWLEDEETCVEFIIAHEQVPDSGVYGQEPTFWNKLRTVLDDVEDADLGNFRRAFVGLGPGQNDPGKAQASLAPITIGGGSGNSMQDLLLSVFGFKFGSMIRTGELTQLAEGGNWIRLNLKDPRTP